MIRSAHQILRQSFPFLKGQYLNSFHPQVEPMTPKCWPHMGAGSHKTMAQGLGLTSSRCGSQMNRITGPASRQLFQASGGVVSLDVHRPVRSQGARRLRGQGHTGREWGRGVHMVSLSLWSLLHAPPLPQAQAGRGTCSPSLSWLVAEQGLNNEPPKSHCNTLF